MELHQVAGQSEEVPQHGAWVTVPWLEMTSRRTPSDGFCMCPLKSCAAEQARVVD